MAATDHGVFVLTKGADVGLDDLDEVPEDVHRIVLGASLDPTSSTTFGHVGCSRLVVRRTSDAEPLVEYPISDADDELALLFGEFYRRDDRWRLRAIGQGHALGPAALVQDFGIEIGTAEDTADTVEADTVEAEAVVTGGTELMVTERDTARRRRHRP